MRGIIATYNYFNYATIIEIEIIASCNYETMPTTCKAQAVASSRRIAG